MDKLKANIHIWLNELLDGTDFYLIDLKTSGNVGSQKILITLDSEEGISIEDCAKISRALSKRLDEIEEENDAPFHLEVGSPGLDQPLTDIRQYKKNIGRELHIISNENKEYKGRLEKVEDAGIELLEISQKGNKKAKNYNKEVTFLGFNEIKKTSILITFS